MKSNGDFSFLGSLWSTDCATPSVRPERLDDSLSPSLAVERQAAALLKAARYPILINMHDQTANQTLVVSCEGEVENVEREGGQKKKTKVHVLFTKIWKDDVCWSVRLLS